MSEAEALPETVSMRDWRALGRRLSPLHILAFARDNFARNMSYLEPTMDAVALFGFVMFPAYYVVWRYWFPQPYESLSLRIVGSLLCLAILFRRRWRERFPRLELAMQYIATLYFFVFFFGFMLLKNDLNQVWVMSALVAAFLLVLLVDWFNTLIQLVVGYALAWVLFAATTGTIFLPRFYTEYLPVLAFAIGAGALFTYKDALIKRERLRAMTTVAGNIAHEIRTPLLAIRAGAAGVQRLLPTLLKAYEAAESDGVEVPRIRKPQRDGLEKVMERIEAETDYANVVIDMLLTNAGRTELDASRFSVCSARACVDQALERFPFKSDDERRKVVWKGRDDFAFRGSEQLMVHVLFNLIKNALYFVGEAGKGEITIRLQPGERHNLLIFRDTGAGIPPDEMPRIFEPFFTSRQHAAGTGMGLAFSRMVMHGFGGEIGCRSAFGAFTEFVLQFPAVDGHGDE